MGNTVIVIRVTIITSTVVITMNTRFFFWVIGTQMNRLHVAIAYVIERNGTARKKIKIVRGAEQYA